MGTTLVTIILLLFLAASFLLTLALSLAVRQLAKYQSEQLVNLTQSHLQLQASHLQLQQQYLNLLQMLFPGSLAQPSNPTAPSESSETAMNSASSMSSELPGTDAPTDTPETSNPQAQSRG